MTFQNKDFNQENFRLKDKLLCGTLLESFFKKANKLHNSVRKYNTKNGHDFLES